MKIPQKQTQLAETLILAIRLLIALVFINYGISKLNGGQFGRLTEEELATPIKELSLFKVGWYLFDHQPFRAFIGISQIVASLLLLYRRTLIIGALMFIPIIANILIIDLTIMAHESKGVFLFRLTGYLCYIGFLLYHFRPQLIPVWDRISRVEPMPAGHNVYSYVIALLLVPLLEVTPALFKMFFKVCFGL